MRFVLIISLVISTLLTASPIHKTIDELLQNEQEKKVEIPQYDPFKRAKPLLIRKSSKRLVDKPAALELIALLNDKAFINGKWYREGESLAEGKVIKITAQSVHLKKGTTIKILRLKKEKKLLRISEKDRK